MCTCILLVVFLWFHVYLWVFLEVEFCQLCVVIEALPLVLEVVVGEEACVHVLAQELAQLKHHLVLHHLRKTRILREGKTSEMVVPSVESLSC